jgi:NADH:ubiquinone oxidoreductase subunit K
LFLVWFFAVKAIQDGDIVLVVAENKFNCVYFSLFIRDVEIIHVCSVEEISNSSQLIFVRVARISRNDNIRGGGFSIFVEGDVVICFDQGEVQKIKFIVYF